jgi:hypothetical protein
MRFLKAFFWWLLIADIWLLPYYSVAQTNPLIPGFQKAEFIEMLHVAAGHIDTLTIGLPRLYKKVYRSPIVGLDNRWELWQGDNGVGVISIRGTGIKPAGWIENFYAAMLPATGQLQLNDNQTFTYSLAKNPGAAIHAGWLIGMASLANDILPKLDSCIQRGTRSFIITGASQGGAIAFLMTSYLHSQLGKRLPNDLRFKTYCIAAPKPGNFSYAYEYGILTQQGWGFNVINSADWVPEFPLSVQTTDDFNLTNPFTTLTKAIQKQSFFNRVALKYIFKKMDRPSRKAQKQYQRFLGTYVERMAKKVLPGYRAPSYAPSSYYVRAGQTIVLDADEIYYQQFPPSTQHLFQNHVLEPYLFLGNRLP